MTKLIVTLALAALVSTPVLAQSGGASPPPGGPATSPMNPSIQTAPMAKPSTPAEAKGMPESGVISTDAEALRRLEADGYRNVTKLERGADGSWRASAMRGAANVTVMMDARGMIKAQ